MKYFFLLSTVMSVISFIVLLFQTVGSMNFYVCIAALACFMAVALVSGILVRKGK